MIQDPEVAAAPAHVHLVESIKALARRASIETSTRNLVEIDAYPALLPRGTDVYVAWLPGSPYHHVVSVAKRLRLAGMNPVPHIAARQLATRGVATDFLASLRDEADVTRALIIAGDSEAQAGAYDSSAALLETGLLQAHGIRSVGIAGYPEGHRRIPEATLMAALDRKIGYAARHGIDLFMVTQFCFDGQAILDWLGRLRARGVVLPVRVGVAGPATHPHAAQLRHALRHRQFDPRAGVAGHIADAPACAARPGKGRSPHRCVAGGTRHGRPALVPVWRLCAFGAVDR